MKKSLCLLIFVVFFLAVVPSLSADPAGASPPLEELEKEIKVTSLKLGVLRLELENSRLDALLDLLKENQKLLKLLKKMPSFLGDGKKEEREAAQRFVKRTEEFFKLSPSPQKSSKDIMPLVLGQLQKKPLPKELTEIQKRLVKAAGKDMNFGKLVDEASAVLDEDKSTLEKLRKQLDSKISELKKEIEKLSHKDKK